MTYTYKTRGTCSRSITIELEDGVITGTMNYFVAGVKEA